MIARYQIESDALSINHERTENVLLSEHDLAVFQSFCDIPSAIYPINASNFCIASLCIQETKLVHSNCQALVELHPTIHLVDSTTGRLMVMVS